MKIATNSTDNMLTTESPKRDFSSILTISVGGAQVAIDGIQSKRSQVLKQRESLKHLNSRLLQRNKHKYKNQDYIDQDEAQVVFEKANVKSDLLK